MLRWIAGVRAICLACQQLIDDRPPVSISRAEWLLVNTNSDSQPSVQTKRARRFGEEKVRVSRRLKRENSRHLRSHESKIGRFLLAAAADSALGMS